MTATLQTSPWWTRPASPTPAGSGADGGTGASRRSARSVPSQKRPDGGSGRPSGDRPSVNCRAGSYGAIHGASSAAPITAATTTSPNTAARVRLTRSHTVAGDEARLRAGAVAVTITAALSECVRGRTEVDCPIYTAAPVAPPSPPDAYRRAGLCRRKV